MVQQKGKGDPENESELEEEAQQSFQIVRPLEVNNFVLEIKNTKSFKNTNAAREITYQAKLKHPIDNLLLNDLGPNLQALFQTILDELKQDYGNEGVARIYINHPNLQRAIIIPPTYLGDLEIENILEHIDTVLYSAGEIPADEALDINVACVQLLKGNGRKPLLNLDTDIKKKRCFVRIVNSDNSCLPRSIVVGLAKLKLDENPGSVYLSKQYDRVRNSRINIQKREAEELRKNVGIPEDRAGLLTDIPLYEDYLQVSISVISSQIGNRKVYNGSEKYNRKIFLYHSNDHSKNGHFDTITKINAVMCTQYYCNACGKGFKSRTSHKCKDWCNICGRENCQLKEDHICPDCNASCRSYDCFEAHKRKRKGRGKYKDVNLQSFCEQYWKCPDCGLNLKREDRDISSHECGEMKCHTCHQYYIGNDHKCYMRAFTAETKTSKLIFYDFECQQVEGVHKPNFLVAQTVCDMCESHTVDSESICYNCGHRCQICGVFNKKEQQFEREPCNGCAKRQLIFSGPNTANDFCEWLVHERNTNATAIAHNARSYDAYFIYDYLMKNSIVPEPTIFSGSKIMYMKIGRGLNIRLLDSLNFLPMPLAKLPKSFGLEEKKKGFFPHFFNTPEHENKIFTSLPDKKYYDPDTMSPERRAEFLEWYELHKNYPFDFQKEMKEYCESDVNILLNACCKFKQLLREETAICETINDPHEMLMKTIKTHAVDPFAFLTIASVCLGIFRSKFLTETWAVLTEEEIKAHPTCRHDWKCQCKWLEGRKLNGDSDLEILYKEMWVPKSTLKIVKEKFVKSAIGLIPPHGYAGKENHSKESMEWIFTLEKKYKDNGIDISIQHARNGGEKIVPYKGKNQVIKYQLDGFFQIGEVKYACEYYGCNWHGCKTCFKHDREIILNNKKSLGQRYRETKLKEKRLRELGYVVITKWSCEWAQEKKEQSLKDFVTSLNIQDPINIRDCYFGGRTNALILHKIFKDGDDEKGYYVDFTSLYPDVLKYQRYPVGHPTKIINNFKQVESKICNGMCEYVHCNGFHYVLPYFGIIKATFLPPTNLIHPVLPLKCNQKLKFPLCYRCATHEEKNECICSDEERSFTHTYCTPEVEVALNAGYEIIQIHEVLHWEETEMYDIISKQGGLFTNYINTFLKLKQQANGFPLHIDTCEKQDDYVKRYFEHEGIQLNKNCMKKNPGLRSLSKLALNSFYGKFGQRTNMKKTKFITDIGVLFNYLTDPTKEVTDFHIMSEDIIELEFQHAQDFEPVSLNTNVVIAAFCTSWARLKLWFVMQKLGKRVLYHDTDSIIFSAKKNEYVPQLGEYLGDLTNELSCKELSCKVDKCEGHWIKEFISCGPKNYTYKLNTGEVVCKVRGFSLNHKASKIINFESMKKALYAWKNNENHQLVTITTEVLRNKHKPRVYTRTVKKHYGVVYDKRRVFEDMTTVPYGYRSSCL